MGCPPGIVAVEVATHNPLRDFHFELKRTPAAGTGDPDLRSCFTETSSFVRLKPGGKVAYLAKISAFATLGPILFGISHCSSVQHWENSMLPVRSTKTR